jgi:hypothetical protein
MKKKNKNRMSRWVLEEQTDFEVFPSVKQDFQHHKYKA